ncbi:MAG TPA: hypothetical protein VFV73_31790 [Streptosporangiaceae bacterium]|nr:hypothetical protein [Streptosporangiaceae bacterium]
MRTNVFRARLTTVLLAAAVVPGLAGCASAAGQAVDSAPTLSAAAAKVPWSKIGPGWELVQLTSGTAARPGPGLLDLVDPAGRRYELYRLPAVAPGAFPWILVDWSADKTQALLTGPPNQVEQVSLTSGTMTRFTLAGHALAVGYAGTSRDILGFRDLSHGPDTPARYSPSGRRIAVLATGRFSGIAFQGTSGTYVFGGASGLILASTSRGVIRRLPVPGAGPYDCAPMRWWDARTLLVTCSTSAGSRLWLVPAGGARPAPLTPLRGDPGPDHRDIGAWSLAGRLYLQAAGACGTVQIYRQEPGGQVTSVAVPHTVGNNNRIITALGPRLLVEAQTDCPGSESLLWFDPRTNAEQWLIRTSPGRYGLQAVIPFASRENA